MVEGPVQPSKLVGYAGLAAGFGVGYMVSGMFLRLSERIAGLMGSVFTGTQRAGSGPGSDVDWTVWGSWLISVAIWAGIALWGYSRFKGSSGFGNGLLFGLGLGGAVEELFQVPGGM